MLLEQVVCIDTPHGPEDIALDLLITPIELIQHGLYFGAFGVSCAGAGIFLDRPVHFGAEAAQGVFMGVSQGPDHGQLALEKGLKRDHGANLACIEHVQKQGFDQVVPVVTQGQLVTTVFSNDFEQALAAQPGT